ncbi:hypothetical protein [Streptomyces antimycoticus]|uniref:hypothetical protein n=1 Tax=Streptomyces antimycoticus TaxID=68175 RepID=UPI001D14CDE4|nr:hypothetical protein [Streptomyces antimycoticus]
MRSGLLGVVPVGEQPQCVECRGEFRWRRGGGRAQVQQVEQRGRRRHPPAAGRPSAAKVFSG